MNKIVIIGYGWVGQANALALTLMGEKVSYFDPGQPKLHYEYKYGEIYKKVERLSSLESIDGEQTCYIVCVGDKYLPNGEQDITLIRSAMESLKNLKGTVVLRSTIIPESLATLKFDFYMPEFLHEKKAVEECLKPHFFVLGEKVPDSKQPTFFKKLNHSAHKSYVGTPEEASYIKYLSNNWNSLRIAFVNEYGNAMRTPNTQQNIDTINRVLDFVLGGGAYMRYGKAFGGHCLPKDINAFVFAQEKKGVKTPLLAGAKESNTLHEKVQDTYPLLKEWYSEWELPEISLITSVKVIGRILYRKFRSTMDKNYNSNKE